MSWPCLIEAALKVSRAGAGGEETGGIVAAGQLHQQRLYSRVAELNAQPVCRALPTVIAIGVEADVGETTSATAQFGQLPVVEMRP
jgi:hypothetical protein